MGYSIGLIIVMMVLFYFMLIRPENKRKKEAEQMRSALKVGDEITTIGGITGHRRQREGRQVRHRDRRRSGPHRVRQVGPVHQRLRCRRRQGRGQEAQEAKAKAKAAKKAEKSK